MKMNAFKGMFASSMVFLQANCHARVPKFNSSRSLPSVRWQLILFIKDMPTSILGHSFKFKV